MEMKKGDIAVLLNKPESLSLVQWSIVPLAILFQVLTTVMPVMAKAGKIVDAFIIPSAIDSIILLRSHSLTAIQQQSAAFMG